MKSKSLGICIPTAMLLVSCSNQVDTFPTWGVIGAYDITGQVVDKFTERPVSGVLMVATISGRGYIREPLNYDIGYAITDDSGRFTIRAKPRKVYNLRRSDTSIYIESFKYGFATTQNYISREIPTSLPVIKLTGTYSEKIMVNYLYQTPETIDRIRKHVFQSAP